MSISHVPKGGGIMRHLVVKLQIATNCVTCYQSNQSIKGKNKNKIRHFFSSTAIEDFVYMSLVCDRKNTHSRYRPR